MNGQRAFGGTLIASRQARPYHLTQAEIAADESAGRPGGLCKTLLEKVKPDCGAE